MRLIDADELKKKFSERSFWTYTHEYGDAIPIGWIMSGIDNAPTADDWQKYSDELWKNAYERGKQDARPQGEWIYDENLCNWKCSQCFETPKTIGYVGNRDFMNEHFKFCNHCGAKMSS